jgi:hypothetical protein
MPTVTFLSSRFTNTPASDAINDMLGKDLAEWLRPQLASRGFEVGEVIAEDYGYGFWIKLDGAHYWITATQYDGDSQPPTWMIGIDYDPGCLWVWRLRSRPKAENIEAIRGAVDAILKGDGQIAAVAWDD